MPGKLHFNKSEGQVFSVLSIELVEIIGLSTSKARTIIRNGTKSYLVIIVEMYVPPCYPLHPSQDVWQVFVLMTRILIG